MRLESPLVELRAAEGTECIGVSLKAEDQTLLTHDDVGDEVEAGPPDEVEPFLGLAQDLVERRPCENPRAYSCANRVAGVVQGPVLYGLFEGPRQEIHVGPYVLAPDADRVTERLVDHRAVSVELRLLLAARGRAGRIGYRSGSRRRRGRGGWP